MLGGRDIFEIKSIVMSRQTELYDDLKTDILDRAVQDVRRYCVSARTGLPGVNTL